MDKDTQIPPSVEGLATLLVLKDQIKNLSNIREFGFFSTNETHRLMHYNTAYLWRKWGPIEVQLLAQSETAELDLQSPVSLWITEVIHEMLEMHNVKTILSLNFAETVIKNVSETDDENTPFELSKRIKKNWPELLPKYVLWIPFLNESNEVSGGLIFFREEPFSDQETKMFRWLANSYQYTWNILTKSKLSPFKRWIKKKPYMKILFVLLILIALIPTRISTTASATVESSDQAPISAPIPGTIKEFFVKPGEAVKAGQLLLMLDKSELEKSLAILQKKVQLSEAKLRSIINQGYQNGEARNEIPILSAQLAIDESELDYTKSMLDKTDIKSPINGIAIFESKEAWIGQPVQVGDNIMTISSLNHPQLKISLLVSDLISLKVGTYGEFYPYGKLSSIPVFLTTIGYNAKMTPSRVLAYQFIARFVDPKAAPMIGSQGIVHLYGQHVPFIYYLLRRPLQGLRQTIGF